MTDSSHKEPKLDRLAAEIADAGVAPAVSLACASYSGSAWWLGLGAAGHTGRAPVDPATLFDIASVSKPVFALTLARLSRLQSGLLARTLGELLPDVRHSASAETPLELLLSHRAGLAAHIELFGVMRQRRALRRTELLRAAADARRPGCEGEAPPAGFPPLYSDLGYLLAGAATEACFSRPLDELIAEQVSSPLNVELGSARQWLKRDSGFLRRVAPSETLAWRGGELRGVVHDENAWTLAGHGASGHAGLFGTAEAVARFGMALLDVVAGRRSDWLLTRELEPLLRRRPGGTLRAGFDGKAERGSSAGERASADTFGHLGFTGTSLWCDPVAESVVVLLSNRVCPTRANLAIRTARPSTHDRLFQTAASRGAS